MTLALPTSRSTEIPRHLVPPSAVGRSTPLPERDTGADPSILTVADSFPPPGWELASPAAVKVLVTLTALAPAGQLPPKRLGVLTGLSKRGALSGLKEAAVLGWLSYDDSVKKIAWRLQQMPAVLSPEAQKFYEDKLKKRTSTQKETVAGMRRQLDEAVNGVAQIRFAEQAQIVEQQLANDPKLPEDDAEEEDEDGPCETET